MTKDRNEQQHRSASETRMQDLSHAIISILDNIPWPAIVLVWLCTLEASTTLLFPPRSQCTNICAAAGWSQQILDEDTRGQWWFCSVPLTATNVPHRPTWARPGAPSSAQYPAHPTLSTPAFFFVKPCRSCWGNGTTSHPLDTHCLRLTVIYTLLFPKPPAFSYGLATQGYKRAEVNRLYSELPKPAPS